MACSRRSIDDVSLLIVHHTAGGEVCAYDTTFFLCSNALTCARVIYCAGSSPRNLGCLSKLPAARTRETILGSTVPQVSEELKIHPATVRAWVKSGRLAAVRAGRTWRVRRSEVDRALLSDASPAYARQEGLSSATPESQNGQQRRQAPMQIADHLIETPGPRPASSHDQRRAGGDRAGPARRPALERGARNERRGAAGSRVRAPRPRDRERRRAGGRRPATRGPPRPRSSPAPRGAKHAALA